MTSEAIMHILLIAVSYYLFSKQFFSFAAEIGDKKVVRGQHFVCFCIVYLWFFIASLLQLPLVVNWFVFLILLVFEVHFVLKYQFLVSYALSMFCTIMGLSINIMCRSLMALLFNFPLKTFDNMLNFNKVYPIFFGFILMFILFTLLRAIHFPKQLSKMIDNEKCMNFYIWIEACVYLFLLTQLLVYSRADNLIGIKLWGMKASLFSIGVLLVTNIYALRFVSLDRYMDKQHKIRQQLIQEKEDMNKLWELAYVDMLTGCFNRQLFNKRVEEYVGYGGKMTLAFVDLNGLKSVNDRYGHLEGDVYLKSVVSHLMDMLGHHHIDVFRYGGDEFILLSHFLNAHQLEEKLHEVNHQLLMEHRMQYIQSISFGVVEGNSQDYEILIKRADELMYQHKRESQ